MACYQSPTLQFLWNLPLFRCAFFYANELAWVLHIYHLWSSFRKVLSEAEICGPELMFFRNGRLVLNKFGNIWRDNLRQYRLVSIFFRLQFSRWFDVHCVSFHCLKTSYTELRDVLSLFFHIMAFWMTQRQLHLSETQLHLYFDPPYNMQK